MQKILIHTDGGSRGNPGPAAIGIVLYDEQHNEIESFSARAGETTNNVAEYLALIKGLQLAAKHTKAEVNVFMDSELIVKQMQGLYRIKTPHLLPFYNEVKASERIFQKVSYTHVKRENIYQTRADQLVNDALDS